MWNITRRERKRKRNILKFSASVMCSWFVYFDTLWHGVHRFWNSQRLLFSGLVYFNFGSAIRCISILRGQKYRLENSEANGGVCKLIFCSLNAQINMHKLIGRILQESSEWISLLCHSLERNERNWFSSERSLTTKTSHLLREKWWIWV